MTLGDIIARYVEQQRCLGKRFSAEATILAAFRSAVSDALLRDIRPDMISRFVNRDGTSDETKHKKLPLRRRPPQRKPRNGRRSKTLHRWYLLAFL
jgi:hypothetical protein